MGGVDQLATLEGFQKEAIRDSKKYASIFEQMCIAANRLEIPQWLECYAKYMVPLRISEFRRIGASDEEVSVYVRTLHFYFVRELRRFHDRIGDVVVPFSVLECGGVY